MRQVLCPVLVGRDEEASHLQAALAAAEAGHGGTVLLTGEAGIGKSRLVREIARTAGSRGFTVLTGRAVAGGSQRRSGRSPRRWCRPGELAGSRSAPNWTRSGPHWAGCRGIEKDDWTRL